MMISFIKKAVAALLLVVGLVQSTGVDEQAERGKTVVVTSTRTVAPPSATPAPSITTTTPHSPPVVTVTDITTITSVKPYPEPPLPPAPPNERPRLCTRYGPQHSNPYAQYYIILEAGLRPSEIEDLCGGLWDNLFGTLRDRECLVVLPGEFCGALPGEADGVVGWHFGAGWGCSNGRVEESFFAATNNGQYGNLTCNTCHKPWFGGDCEGLERFNGI